MLPLNYLIRKVNPFDLDQMADGICEALEMSKKEQTRRMRTMQKTFTLYSSKVGWGFYEKTSKKSDLSSDHKTTRINRNIEIDICKKFKKSDKQILFLDYDAL